MNRRIRRRSIHYRENNDSTIWVALVLIPTKLIMKSTIYKSFFHFSLGIYLSFLYLLPVQVSSLLPPSLLSSSPFSPPFISSTYSSSPFSSSLSHFSDVSSVVNPNISRVFSKSILEDEGRGKKEIDKEYDNGDYNILDTNRFEKKEMMTSIESRRRFFFKIGFTGASYLPFASAAVIAATSEGDIPIQPNNINNSNTINNINSNNEFRSAAYGREELTNSITASRDTNISPREAYDSILTNPSLLQPIERIGALSSTSMKNKTEKRIPRALDMGAGAGVSTQILWEMGYRYIEACDWSDKAWDEYVGEGKMVGDKGSVDNFSDGDITEIPETPPKGRCPSSVKFYPVDDERYISQVWRPRRRNYSTTNNNNLQDVESIKFDAIVYNFAVNEAKARSTAIELLTSDYGRLLAPVNARNDYWLAQSYRVYDSTGAVVVIGNTGTDTRTGTVLGESGGGIGRSRGKYSNNSNGSNDSSVVGAWNVQYQPDVTSETCQGVWCAPFNGFQKMKR